ncbi:MAG TPA: 4Fe-4S dicluster domain-containing protein [Azospirillaceae bacterium]|nr:4Fe-4S dicluster domain-containing protein [Azospirillaceae bacterium]
MAQQDVTKALIGRDGLDTLIAVLARQGYSVIGPKVADGAIVYEPVETAAELPAGWLDEQEGGSYRLTRGDDDAVFAHVVGPHTWKRFLFPPRQKLWQGERKDGSYTIESAPVEVPRYAFLGVRACELKALAIQDRVFSGGQYVDPGYTARRQAALIVAVTCGRAAATCFCTSMDAGPKVTAGFDLALTELIDGDRHDFMVEAGSDQGHAILAELNGRAPSDDDLAAVESVPIRATAQMRRAMVPGVDALLKRNLEHTRWDEVAARCLNCANCTMVCPTCFCSTVEDVTDLTGDHAERWRTWDSCFTVDFSYIHGGPIRREGFSRYRQWMTHKLSNWHDQFGSSGCVGCGRCVTWCPVGIDITEEARAIRDSEGSP